MPELTEEERQILFQAHEIKERIRAEQLEAGEITLEEAVAQERAEQQIVRQSARQKGYVEQNPPRRNGADRSPDPEEEYEAYARPKRSSAGYTEESDGVERGMREKPYEGTRSSSSGRLREEADSELAESFREEGSGSTRRRVPRQNAEDYASEDIIGREQLLAEREESRRTSRRRVRKRTKTETREEEAAYPDREETRQRDAYPERDENRQRDAERERGENRQRSADREREDKRQRDTEKERRENRRRDSGEEEDRTRDRERPENSGETSGKNGSGKRRKKKKSLLRTILKVFLALFTVLILALASLFVAFRVLVSKTNYQPYETSYVRAPDVYVEKGVTNILLIGTDNRVQGDDTSRSDAMIVLSLNPKKRRIVMTSILRDSYVNIPNVGQNRINHAYQVGGPALLIQTIEENFKLAIDAYIQVDFYSFIDVIDAFGGVYIDVTDATLMNYINGYVSELNHVEGKEEGYSFLNEPGFQLLNGRQALGYSRIRAIGTDFARTGRQRTVLEALMRQIKAQPHKIVEAINRVLPDLTTNIDDNRMFLYGLETISLMLLNHISQFQVPAEHYWENAYMPNGQEVLAIDFEHNNIDLRRAIYE